MKEKEQTICGPLLLLSAGRSGSTYVQRVLNCCENAFIFGEHSGAIGSLARSISGIEVNSGDQIKGADLIIKKGMSKSFTAWATPFEERDIHLAIGKQLESLYTARIPHSRGTALWGIKEIRYDGSDLKRLVQLFPTARVLILIRDFGDYARSATRAFLGGKEITQAELSALLSHYIFLYSSLIFSCRSFGIDHRILRYEDAKRDWRMIIEACRQLYSSIEFDLNEHSAKLAASTFSDYVPKEEPNSPARARFLDTLNDVLTAGGAQKLADLNALIEKRGENQERPSLVGERVKNADLLEKSGNTDRKINSFFRRHVFRLS